MSRSLEKIIIKTVAIKVDVAIWVSEFVSRTVRCNACGNSSNKIWHNKMNFTFCKSNLVTFALTEAPHIRRIICRSYFTRAIKHGSEVRAVLLILKQQFIPKVNNSLPHLHFNAGWSGFVRHVCKCVTVAGRCLLDQFISVLPLCICFSFPLLSSIHTHTTGLIFLQPAVKETSFISSKCYCPLYMAVNLHTIRPL
jgi:hypothetical protein